MFRFANIELLYLLAAVPVFVVLFWIALRRKKKMLGRFGDINIIKQLMPDSSSERPIIKFIFILLAYISLVIAIARPQFGSQLKEVKREGIEIAIALDVSNSMLAEDIKPNRLEKAKQAISRLISRLQSDKVGLIVFAGDAYTQVPMTTDYVSAKMWLSSVNTEIVPKQGTSISSAIELASKSFSPDSKASKAVIIITDGENHEDDAIDAAKKAAEQGILIYTIGIGDPKGAPIPMTSESGVTDFRKDSEGNTIISKLNETMLQDIAVATGAVYSRANSVSFGLNSVLDDMKRLNKAEVKTKVYSAYNDQFQYILGFALFFLLFEFVILERKNRYLKNINLFK
ncbi:MAG: VWA domain-containing protein [Bacteroidales bacterium]|nr:VWA domain-containing protein [Bacteroidales bacterium]